MVFHRADTEKKQLCDLLARPPFCYQIHHLLFTACETSGPPASPALSPYTDPLSLQLRGESGGYCKSACNNDPLWGVIGVQN
jgi:hypothetical protein